MEDNLRKILSDARELSIKFGIGNINIDFIANKLEISKSQLESYFTGDEDLIDRILESERNSFKAIFDENNFEDVNAIEILMIVSQALNSRFFDLTPSVTNDLKQLYPELYQHHLEQRVEFIFEKMKVNIEKGIRQEVYREDLSIELMARLYISRLYDLHNPDFFPPDRFSFKVLYEVMIDSFIRGIANEEGLSQYKKLRKVYKMC